ncbi:unnamed protein product [Cyprideis torosa]|uniref:Uncharacterized protein n=1 Tax=Cyprideis torosa TaxID=163714 RepID=A0A7R8ZI95_9CRUS|nr:unnamed protein product [Cyprideis torosa]CAG0879493.1 unnamed protein product [Cyprideis torosa]
MGTTVSKFFPGSATRRKRGRPETEEDSSTEQLPGPPTRKRPKIIGASAYIYQTFFKEGRGSDVVVKGLGGRWKLHKTFLAQSAYFAALFSDRWKKAGQREDSIPKVVLEIPDPLVTKEALDIAFGSLYSDEALEVNVSACVSLLATSHFLQLPTIQSECCRVMVEEVSSDTIVDFLSAVDTYDNPETKEALFQWLLINFWRITEENPQILRGFSSSLLQSIINDGNLVVCQTEFSLYGILTVWLYLKFHDKVEENRFDVLLAEAKTFFEKRGSTSFLNTADGSQYKNVFMGLRLPYLLMHKLDVEVLRREKILPEEVILEHGFGNWMQLLCAFTDTKNSALSLELNEVDFLQNSLRCGRLIHMRENSWRWTGFHYGIDIIVTLFRTSSPLSLITPYSITVQLINLLNPEESSDKSRNVIFSESPERCFLDQWAGVKLVVVQMVVLEPKTSSSPPNTSSMFGNTGRDQYIQPDYLTPLPTTLDAKKSPLALLAQTCSQIGADSSSTSHHKSLIPPLDKKDAGGHRKPASSPRSPGLSSAKSPSASSSLASPNSSRTSPTPRRDASPIVRSGMEVLSGAKDPLSAYRGMYSAHHPLSAFPMFSIPPYLAAPPGIPGYPPAAAAMFNPYLSYLRLKAGDSGSPCFDPYCPGGIACTHSPASLSPPTSSASSKEKKEKSSNSSSSTSASSATSTTSSSSTTTSTASSLGAIPGLPPPFPNGGLPSYVAGSSEPYVCNWVAPGNSSASSSSVGYCGKRFASSDELLTHLRTHTGSLDPALGLFSSALATSPFFGAARGTPGFPDLRYHPYAKPTSSASTPSTSPPGLFHPALANPYYPYSLYGPRLGPPVHP